jgi:hypothetical protein
VAHKLIFNPLIPDDLAEALDYYEKISPDLANRFRTSVDRRLDDIAERPESYPVDVPPIRFAKIERFPYLVFFSVKARFVSVIAIVHGSSEPSKWRSRK